MIKDGKTKLVNVKNQDGLTKLLDMVPGVFEKFSGKNDEKSDEKKDSKE